MELDEKKYIAFLVIVPILVLLFVVNIFWRKRKQKEFGNIVLLKQLSPEQSSSKPILKLVLFLLALVFLIFGLVNPKMGTKSETVKREGIDIVFAIDVSKSMLAEDVAPNRLEKSKQLVSQIINQLTSDRIGVIAYAGSAFPVVPITTDYSVTKMFLQTMSPDMVSSKGTSLEEAIQLSATFFDDKTKTSKLLIMVSDGEDHSEGAVAAAETANEKGLRIISIGVGTENGATIPLRKNGQVEGYQKDKSGNVVTTKLNEQSLQSISKATNGNYINGKNTKEVVEFIKKNLATLQKTEFEAKQKSDFQSQFQWFLAVTFLLLFLDVFVSYKKTKWLQKLNLFNDKS